MTVRVETLCVGPLDVNCYVIGCDIHKVCAVIDPGDSAPGIMDIVNRNGWTVKHILNTHAHADHTGANAKIKEATGADLCIHVDDIKLLTHAAMVDMAGYFGVNPSPQADVALHDGDVLEYCDCLKITVLHTPGHTPGGVCFYYGAGIITGDTLFYMAIGRTDLMGGDSQTLLRSIKAKLFTLPDETLVYPGHGDPTDMGYEKANNPFLICLFA